jgi:nucleotide-binding universal stress UspA family protein
MSILTLEAYKYFPARKEVKQIFERILVAIDGSDHSRRATKIAGDIAGKYGAKLALLHVVGNGKVPASLAGGIATVERGTDSRKDDEQIKESVAEMVLAVAERTAKSKDVPVLSGMTEHGDPVERILACAARENADLIVLGTRGLSDLRGLLMGSVSHKICQLSDCTCITVK